MDNWFKRYKIAEEATLDFLKEIKEVGPSEESSDEYVDMTDWYGKRQDFTKNYGWSVPNEEAIESIKSFVGDETVLEVGSGLGMWAKLLRSEGIKITPTDLSLNLDKNTYISRDKAFLDVEEISGRDAIKKYGNHTVLMMSWPPYDDPFAYNVLKAFMGDKLIFVGEGYGGCTGDDDFFSLLDDEWNHVKEVDIPKWSGIHDHLSLYVRQ
jgi:hypothetical protein